jgi:hypothetical protein
MTSSRDLSAFAAQDSRRDSTSSVRSLKGALQWLATSTTPPGLQRQTDYQEKIPSFSDSNAVSDQESRRDSTTSLRPLKGALQWLATSTTPPGLQRQSDSQEKLPSSSDVATFADQDSRRDSTSSVRSLKGALQWLATSTTPPGLQRQSDYQEKMPSFSNIVTVPTQDIRRDSTASNVSLI